VSVSGNPSENEKRKPARITGFLSSGVNRGINFFQTEESPPLLSLSSSATRLPLLEIEFA
jgi:hypothetical protein